MSIRVSLSLKEIHDSLCPECQKKLEQKLTEKVNAELIKEALKKE